MELSLEEIGSAQSGIRRVMMEEIIKLQLTNGERRGMITRRKRRERGKITIRQEKKENDKNYAIRLISWHSNNMN